MVVGMIFIQHQLKIQGKYWHCILEIGREPQEIFLRNENLSIYSYYQHTFFLITQQNINFLIKLAQFIEQLILLIFFIIYNSYLILCISLQGERAVREKTKYCNNQHFYGKFPECGKRKINIGRCIIHIVLMLLVSEKGGVFIQRI